MKRFGFALALLVLLCVELRGQFSSTAQHIITGAALPVGCASISGDIFMLNVSGTSSPYYCQTPGVWAVIAGGTTVGANFGALTGGTNITAAMVVGAGASLNFTSTGTINASSVRTFIPSQTSAANALVTAGAGGTFDPAFIPATAVTAGSYTLASITVGADGRLTAASSGASPLLPSQGGTGAINTVGAAGHVLRSNGTAYVDSAILAGDLPTTGAPFFLISNNLSEGTPTTMRMNLGLGTAATQNTGTSGLALGFLNANLTFSGSDLFQGAVNFQSTITTNIIGAASQCLQVTAAGIIQGTGSACGTGTGGITSLNTDVVATGPGAAVATIQPAAVTLGKMANLAANSIIGNNTGLAATPIALTSAQVSTLLGLGTAATQNTGTSGANVPLLNGVNTFSGATTFSSTLTTNVTGSIQCLHVNATGVVSGTGADCGAGGAGTPNYHQTISGTSAVLTAGMGIVDTITACYDNTGKEILPDTKTVAQTMPFAITVTFTAPVTTGSYCSVNGSGGGGGGGGGTITLTGDVTGSSVSPVATTIAAAAVTLGKMANLAANSIIGNNTGSAATPIALTSAQVSTFLGLGTAATQNTGTSGATIPLLNGVNTFSGATTFSSTVAISGNLTTNVTGATAQCLQASTTGVVSGTGSTCGSGGGGITALTGDVAASGTGSVIATIQPNRVTLAMMFNLAANSIIGNNTGSAATPLALTGTQVTAMLSPFATGTQGVVPASGGGTVNYLRADGTWQPPGLTALTGDVTAAGNGSQAATIANGAVTLGKMANLAANSIIGNNTGSAATPIALTATQTTAMLNACNATTKGMVPTPPNNTTTFLRGDCSFATPPGSGGWFGGSPNGVISGSCATANNGQWCTYNSPNCTVTTGLAGVAGSNTAISVKSSSANQTCGIQTSVSGDFTHTFAIYPMWNVNFGTSNASIEVGFTDGAQLEYVAFQQITSSASANSVAVGRDQYQLTPASTPANAFGHVAGYFPIFANPSGPIFIQLAKSGTTLTGSWSPDNINWFALFTDTSNTITVNALFVGAYRNGGTDDPTVYLESYQ